MENMRWIEDPGSVGLRLVGLVHEIAPAVDHNGWYLDDDCVDTVSGVVYQVTGKRGAARYVVGYADPWNDGPACLDLVVIEGERRDSDWETNYGLREAACAADGYAERMAEREREYQSAWRAGQEARDLAIEARESCHRWAEQAREVREMFHDRNRMPEHWRRYLRTAIRSTRAARDAFEAARDVARDSRSDGYGNEAWKEGYGYE
jgi:hypothetical protein